MPQTFLNATVSFRNTLYNTGDTEFAYDSFEEDIGNQRVAGSVTLFSDKDHERKLYMYGAVCVKDLKSNRHFVAASNNRNWNHVEGHLTTRVVRHFSDSGTGLTAAKVLLYMPASPCRECTKMIPVWCMSMTAAITKGQKNGVPHE